MSEEYLYPFQLFILTKLITSDPKEQIPFSVGAWSDESDIHTHPVPEGSVSIEENFDQLENNGWITIDTQAEEEVDENTENLFVVKITKNQQEEVRNFLKKYLQKFQNNELFYESEELNILNFSTNIKVTTEHFQGWLRKHAPHKPLSVSLEDVLEVNLTYDHPGVGFDKPDVENNQTDYRFWESLLWLQNQQKLEIKKVRSVNSALVDILSEDFFLNDLEEIKLKHEIDHVDHDRDKNNIRSIKAVKYENSDKMLVILNNDFSNPIELNLNHQSTRTFLKLIKQGQVDFDKSVRDYFNSRQENKIYTDTDFTTQTLIEKSGPYMFLKPDAKVISPQEYKRKINDRN